MDKISQLSDELQRTREAARIAEQDDSMSPLRKAVLLDEYAELLAPCPGQAEDSKAIKQRACAIRAAHYKSELDNDNTTELDLRRMLRQSAAAEQALTSDAIASVEDFDAMIAARSSSKATGGNDGKGGKRNQTTRILMVVIGVVLLVATVIGFVFMSMHGAAPGPLPDSLGLPIHR